MSAFESERPSELHSLHFDLSKVPAETPYTFHVALNEYPIATHSQQTLNDAREHNGLLRVLPDTVITHRADVAMPSDAVALAYVTRPVTVDGFATTQVVSMAIHLPRETRLRDVRRGHFLHAERLHPKLRYRRLGGHLLHSELLDLDRAPDLLADYHDAYETAVALLFHHPELVHLNKDASVGGPSTVIEECIRKALDEYSLLTDTIDDYASEWSTVERVLEDGKPAFDNDGKPLFTMGLHPEVRSMLANPLSRALVYAKQSEGLKGQLWSVQYGRTTAAYSGDVKPKPKTLEAEPLRAATDVRWRMKNLTPSSGLVLEDIAPFTAAEPGTNWRADGYWSSEEDKAVGPFDEEMQKALADGKLWVLFDALAGQVKRDPSEAGKYTVEIGTAGAARRATGTCRLNTDGTELQYLVTSTTGPFTTAGFAVGDAAGSLRTVHPIAVRNSGSNGTMTVKAKNHWLRHLGAYVEFLDTTGKAKAPPDWSSRFPVLGGVYDDSPTKRFLDIVGPVETMMGIPLSADTTNLTFPVPADAAMVRITFGGLGSGERDSVACPPGELLTVLLEMALPVVLLAAGAALTRAGGLMKIIKEKPVVGAMLVSLGGLYVGVSDDHAKAAWTIGKKLIPAIAKAGITKLSVAITQSIAASAALKAVPFMNIVMLVADIAATAASLGQTATAIRDSPRAHVTEITRSIDLKVTVRSSRIWKKFPDHHHHLSVVVAYDSGTTLPALTKNLPATTISDDIIVEFREVPAAGNLRVLVFFYAENGWQSGQGASGWMKAEGSGGSAVLETPAIEIDVNEVPLGTWSVYEHTEKIDYANGQHVWKAAPAPTATKFTKAPGIGVMEKLHSITVAQFSQMVGYAWQATELNVPPDDASKPATNRSLFTVQNLSLLQSPEKGYAAPNVGFSNAGGIAYDVVSPDDGSGRNFFIDPTRGSYDETGNPAGGFHLRRVSVSFKGAVPEYKPRTNASWGRFRDAVDSMVIHPHGYVFAIRRGTHKVYRILIPAQAVPDADAAMATMFSSEGTRDGLIKGPVSITLALDGRVLVLEGSNERAQCFDIEGNPVAYFTDPATGAKTPMLSVRRDERMTLLDMAVEAKGHIFVLGYTGDGRKPSDYRLDLYDPAGVFLTSTRNFTAARITVDLLRNLFALNYEVLLGRNGRTEPSISHWRPPAPPPSPKGEA